MGSSDINESDLDKNNIIKPTFDTLMEEDCKALEAYHTEMDELFYSCYEGKWQGLVLMDTSPNIIQKDEVTPEVRPNPLLSLDDVQFLLLMLLILLKPILKQVAHRRVALQCQTHQSSR
jgi:hypothetical protein